MSVLQKYILTNQLPANTYEQLTQFVNESSSLCDGLGNVLTQSLNITSSTSISSSFSITSSFAATSSYEYISVFSITSSWSSASLSSSFATSSSFAVSASWAPPVISNFSVSSSWASSSLSASYSVTASYVANAQGTVLVTGSTYPITASWASNAISITSSYLSGSTIISPSNQLNITASTINMDSDAVNIGNNSLISTATLLIKGTTFGEISILSSTGDMNINVEGNQAVIQTNTIPLLITSEDAALSLDPTNNLNGGTYLYDSSSRGLQITNGILTGSGQGIINIQTSSFALSSSFNVGIPQIQAGVVNIPNGSTGSLIIFNKPFQNVNYIVNLTPTGSAISGSFVKTPLTTTGFTASYQPYTGSIMWMAVSIT